MEPLRCLQAEVLPFPEVLEKCLVLQAEVLLPPTKPESILCIGAAVHENLDVLAG